MRHVALIAGLVLAACGPAAAQENQATTVPWAYSNYFGTGWYEIGADRDAFVLRYVYRRTLSEARIDDEGRRHAGWQWRIPVTLGLSQFPLEDLAGSVNPDNFANLSVTPGLWVTLPVSERFTLRPFAAAGWGTVLDGNESAFSYWAGVNSRYLLSDGRFRVALVNSLGFVGYTPNEGPSDRFWPLLAAIEFGHPVAEFDGGDDSLRLVWHAGYTHFLGELELTRPDGEVEKVTQQWEIGAAIRRENGPLKLGFLRLDRFGLAYRFSGDGELEGIGLVLNSLFD